MIFLASKNNGLPFIKDCNQKISNQDMKASHTCGLERDAVKIWKEPINLNFKHHIDSLTNALK